MGGNTFGKFFSVTTWGESHGPALGVVVDGFPPGLPLSEEVIQVELDKRRPGAGGISSTPRKESDRVELLSGVFEGVTTGTSISMLVRNQDAKSSSYEHLKEIFRPGHGDFTYWKKYGIRDHRGGGRSSGRETVARVAAGAVAKVLLDKHNVDVIAYTYCYGGVCVKQVDLNHININPFFTPDLELVETFEGLAKQARAEGDSLGGVVEIIVKGAPAGLGEPVFDKLDADLAKALMSIGAVKGVEIGSGFSSAAMKGSQNNDQMDANGFLTNNSGGILAGISNGDDIVCRVAVKPIPSINKLQKTTDTSGNECEIVVGGRHDVSAIPRIVPVCQAMVRLVIADHFLRQKAIQ